jgi:hypothetical protein
VQSVLADGDTPTPISFEVTDAHGNPVPDVAIQSRATAGEVSAVQGSEEGTYSLDYTPPLRRDPGQAQLHLTASPQVADKLEIELLEKAYLLTLSARAGFLTNFGHLNSPCFTAGLGFNLGFLSNRLFLLAEAGYYYSNQEDTVEDLQVTSNLGVVPLTLSLGYSIRFNDWFQLLAALGGGALHTTTRTTVENQEPDLQSSAMVGAFLGYAEAGFLLGPGRITVQLRYTHAASSLEGLSGNLGGLGILAGYQMGFF